MAFSSSDDHVAMLSSVERLTGAMSSVLPSALESIVVWSDGLMFSSVFSSSDDRVALIPSPERLTAAMSSVLPSALESIAFSSDGLMFSSVFCLLTTVSF